MKWRSTNTLSAFQSQGPTTNTSLCRLLVQDYSSDAVSGSADDSTIKPHFPRKEVEAIQSQIVALRYHVYCADSNLDIVCLETNATWNDGDNLVTTNFYYTNGVFDGELRKTFHPDGTASFYEYYQGVNRTNIVLHGEPNAQGTNIVSGTKTVTITGPVGEIISRTETWVNDSTEIVQTASETFSNYDDYQRPQTVTYQDGTSTGVAYACCGTQTMTERDGVTTTNDFDALNRLEKTIRAGITNSLTYDAAGNLLTETRSAGGSSITLARMRYDTAGRLLYKTNALDEVVSYSEVFTNGLRVKTVNFTEGVSKVENYHRDGSLASFINENESGFTNYYGVDSTTGWTYVKQVKLNDNEDETDEWTATYRDLAGRLAKIEYAAASSPYPTHQYLHDGNGQLAQELDPDGVSTLYLYNTKGERDLTAVSANGSASVVTNADRMTQTLTLISTNSDNAVVLRTETYVWITNGSDTPVLIAFQEQGLDNTLSWRGSPAGVEKSGVYYAGSGVRYVTNYAADSTKTISHYLNGLLQSATRLDSNGTQVAKTTFKYDAHGRQYQVVDERNGTTSFTFDDLDRIVTITTPEPGAGQSSQTTTNHYDYYGRVERVDFADGGSVTNEYFKGGELKKRTGSRTYPVEFSYDYAGRKETMKTWQDYAGSSGTAITTWKYDGYRGWLTNKTYQTTNGPSYAYTLGGRLKTRTWARGVTTTYSTNYFGDITGIDYSEEGTPDVSFVRDRLGRPIAVTNGNSVTTISYNDAGQILSETRDGFTVTNAYDALLRLSAVGYDDADADPAEYAFDAASRLSSLTHGLNTADYNYLENSSLIGDIQFKTNGNLRMTASRQYDNLNRLTSVSSVPSASSAVSFSYHYNLANQRTNVTIGPDNSSWRYGYDDLGQVTSGKKYWPDSTPVAGQQFEYEFDDIGNRQWTKAGGDSSGEGLRIANYTNNLLDQITGRGVPGTNDVAGIAHASATVTINGQSTYRKGEYYHLAIGTNNTAGAVGVWVTNLATLGTNSQSVTGRFFLAKAGEAITYDADGNKTGDSRFWYYLWDAENRLKTALGWYPSDARFRVDCTYDYMHRRVSKSVSNWTGSTFVLDYQRKFVYQGWNLVGELDGNNNLLKTHHWGTDASGTMQGAGGVGGLLATVFHTGQYAGTYFPAYDGNWNAVKYVRSSDGAVVAEYEFGPFGELLRASGPMAEEFNFLFSTKYYDWETGLYYYGYRYYDPTSGRWLNRDLIEEKGGKHLSGFVRNQPSNVFDSLGMMACGCICAVEPKRCRINVYWDDQGRMYDFYDIPEIQPPLGPRRFVMKIRALVKLEHGGGESTAGCHLRQDTEGHSSFPQEGKFDWEWAEDYSSKRQIDQNYSGWALWDTPTTEADVADLQKAPVHTYWWQAHVFVEEAPAVETWWGYAGSAFYEPKPVQHGATRWKGEKKYPFCILPGVEMD